MFMYHQHQYNYIFIRHKYSVNNTHETSISYDKLHFESHSNSHLISTRTGDNNKLSENEAVEEIKQLARQLQNLYERIPKRGPTTNVILTMMEICRAAQQQPQNVSSLHPPEPKVAICNGNSSSGTCKPLELATKPLSCVDKETNTSFDNLVRQQFNDANCGHTTMISDKCDQNNTTRNNKCDSHKCCAVSRENNATRTTINDSSNSINFDNLQLQCMCSSESNSVEEFQIDDTCDNCLSIHKDIDSRKFPQTDCRNTDSSSFRERLLNFTSCNHSKSFGREDAFRVNTNTNSLLKRNSELVLGTNFETTCCGEDEEVSDARRRGDGVYRASCQPYRVSCDNIFSNNSEQNSAVNQATSAQAVTTTTKTDCTTSQIPYSFLERPSMKLSQSEDQNLRELKIALSSTLPVANRYSNSNASTCSSYSHPHPLPPDTSIVKPTHLNLKSSISQSVSQPPPPPPRLHQKQQQQHSFTSSSSMSSKIDKASFTPSTSSMSDSATSAQQLQQKNKNIYDEDVRNITDEVHHKKQDEVKLRSINNQNDNKNEDNKMIMAASKNVVDNKASTEEVSVSSSASSSSSNVNKQAINKDDDGGGNEDAINVGSSSSKKRKTPEGKLAIDLNDRSKYTDEVSV